MSLPDLTSFHPGYEKKGSGTPANAGRTARTHTACGRATEEAACAAPSAIGRARLPAFHLGSRQGDLRHPRRNPGHASWDAV